MAINTSTKSVVGAFESHQEKTDYESCCKLGSELLNSTEQFDLNDHIFLLQTQSCNSVMSLKHPVGFVSEPQCDV